jgi:DNA-binding beta-propeller fold protein YncE
MPAFTRRRMITMTGSALLATAVVPEPAPARQRDQVTLVLTNSDSDTVTFLNLATDDREEVTVGTAPWGITRHGRRAFITTAEGVAVLDLHRRKRTALVPYETQPAGLDFGEYRAGGMGVAVSPDGDRVFVGNYLPDGPSRLEVIDWQAEKVLGSIETGVRPFDVVASRDGHTAYSIDHDSYTVTVLDVATMTGRILPVSPLGDALGLAGFEKPHYAVLDPDGRLLLPFQGQILARLDPTTGQYEPIPLIANTHQHGIAINRDGDRLLIVGTGPAGSATASASLTVMDLATNEQTLIPLARTHERVAFSPDERQAYLTGGFSFAGLGWDGITVVDLEQQTTREIAVGAKPLDLLVLTGQESG